MWCSRASASGANGIVACGCGLRAYLLLANTGVSPRFCVLIDLHVGSRTVCGGLGGDVDSVQDGC